MKHAEFLTPWQAKGRWFQFFIESDGNNYALTHADIDEVVLQENTYTMWLPAGYHVLDYKVDIHATETDSYTHEFVIAANGLQGIRIPDVLDFDYCTIWLYAYKED